LDEELPKILAVFTVVFECGVMFAEMLGDCFTASLLHCFIASAAQPLSRSAAQPLSRSAAQPIRKEEIAIIRSGSYKKFELSDAAKKNAPKDRIKAAEAAVKRAKWNRALVSKSRLPSFFEAIQGKACKITEM
jgi:hypothetical protein